MVSVLGTHSCCSCMVRLLVLLEMVACRGWGGQCGLKVLVTSMNSVVAHGFGVSDAGCRVCVIDVKVYSILSSSGVCCCGSKVFMLVHVVWLLVG